MGRGRAKAKQTKVARELKYRKYNTDFSELQRELHGEEDQASAGSRRFESDADEYDDPYADLLRRRRGVRTAALSLIDQARWASRVRRPPSQISRSRPTSRIRSSAIWFGRLVRA